MNSDFTDLKLRFCFVYYLILNLHLFKLFLLFHLFNHSYFAFHFVAKGFYLFFIIILLIDYLLMFNTLI